MALKKVVTIEGKDITVRELLVEDVLALLEIGADLSLPSIVAHLRQTLPRATDCTPEFMATLAPSDLAVLFDAFKEVNAVFFKAADSLGLPLILEQLKSTVPSLFAVQLSGLLSAATETGSGATPGESSASPAASPAKQKKSS